MSFPKKNILSIAFLTVFILILFLNFFLIRKIRWGQLIEMNQDNHMDIFEEKGIFYFDAIDKFAYAEKNGLIIQDNCDSSDRWFSKNLKNKIILSTDYGMSPPGSIKIFINELPCKIYYVKGAVANMINDDTWSFENPAYWFGIKKDAKYRLSFNYKGAGPTIYLNLLRTNSLTEILDFKNLDESLDQWQKVEMTNSIPLYGRALQLEITVNKINKAKTLLIDDVILEII